MKNFLLVLITLFSLHAAAQEAQEIPNELAELVPVGSDSVTLKGQTKAGEECISSISVDEMGFLLTNLIPNEDMTVDPENLAKAQIGLGHELLSLEVEESILRFKTYHEAEESYSSDTKSEVIIEKNENAEISSIQVKYLEKGFFFYKIKSEITCLFQ